MGILAYFLCFFVIVLVLFKMYLIFTLGKYTISNDLTGKIIMITGASAGIGKETAMELARKGATLYLAVRSLSRGKAVADEVKEATGNRNVFVIHLDLADLSSVRKCAEEFLSKEKHLHVLINNAGMIDYNSTKPKVTSDGMEITMQSNHFGHFLLTNLLLDCLKQSAPSRIVNVSSVGHVRASFDIENQPTFQKSAKFSAWNQYRCSKLANIWFTRSLAQRLLGTGVTTNSLHPGAVFTEFIRDLPSWAQGLAGTVGRFIMKTPLEGAQTTLYCAVAPELENVSGHYFSDCRAKASTILSLDDKLAEEFWRVSSKLTSTGQ